MTASMTVLLVGSSGNMGSKIATALSKKEEVEIRALVRSRKAGTTRSSNNLIS